MNVLNQYWTTSIIGHESICFEIDIKIWKFGIQDQIDDNSRV